ncbi:MAG: APC family permease [Clostridioides sp.]|jgi:amino acid transporter|nr:APC family permease [Clostridioides sp.]
MSKNKSKSNGSKEVAGQEHKMGTFSALCMAIGSIVGAGIFGSIPAAAGMVGAGIEWAYIIALFAIICRFLPVVINGSVLPCPAGNYMHATRLVGPTVGFLQATFGFSYFFLLSSLATVFAEYGGIFFPSVDGRILGIISLVLFACITCRGVQASSITQNFMTVMLILAMIMFMAFGFPKIDPNLISVQKIVHPEGMNSVNMGSAVALLSATLIGGHVCMNIAQDLKEPGKAIPISFILSTVVCCILFMLVSYVAIGTSPISELTSLKDVAARFLSGPMMMFFILGGAVFAILTSMNGQFLSGATTIRKISEDKVFPEWLSKVNSHGVPQNTVILLCVGSSVVVGFGLPVGTLLSAYSFLSLITGLILFMAAMRVHKLYPNMYKNAYMKLTPTLIKIISSIGIAISLWQIYSLFRSMKPEVMAVLILWFVVWYIYYYARKSYLAKKGIDLKKMMTVPYPEWVKKEKELGMKKN